MSTALHDLSLASRARDRGRAGPVSRPALLALAGLTAAAFALRIVGFGQSLFGDERYTHSIVSGHGLGDVWHLVYTTSITPPLHYGLAWTSLKLGHDPALIRLPSLVLGTALIPLLFVLARRIGGTRVALIAAAIIALDPFAIFYSTEGRAYETMVFLVAVSTWSLLRALDGRGRTWWVVYAFAGCAALWTHYTAVFVLAVQALWALWVHRERWRAIVLAQVAVAAGYAPWIPGYLEQRHNQGVTIFDQFTHITVGDVFAFPLRTLVGHPFIGLPDAPGPLGLLLVAGVVLLSLAAVAGARTRAADRVARAVPAEVLLVVALALATPVGILLYGVVGPNLFAVRDMSASQPALVIAVALGLAALSRRAPPRAGSAILGALGVVLAIVAVRSTAAVDRRPPYDDVAHYLDRVAGGAPVVDYQELLGPDTRLGTSALDLYVDRPHRIYLGNIDDRPAWRRAAAGEPIYTVQTRQPALSKALGLDDAPASLRARMQRLGGPDGRLVVRSTRTFPGFYDLVVQRLQGRVTGRIERGGGREDISWTLGRRVPVQPGAVRGQVDAITPTSQPLVIGGWALRHTPPDGLVDWFLLFSRGRLVAVSPGGTRRPDVARRAGADAELSGFALSLPGVPVDRPSLRVFALAGGRATELPFSAAARAAAGRP